MPELKECTTNFQPELCGINVIINPQAQTGSDDDRILVVGQVGIGATAAPGSVTQVRDINRGTLFGANSMLNRMIDNVQDYCPTAEIYAYAVPNTGTNGEAVITFTGVTTALKPGRVVLWVDGQPFQATFNTSTDTDATLAQEFALLISTSRPELTVTLAGNVMTIETESFGEIGGALDVRSFYGPRPDLTSSAEVTVGIVRTASTGLPNLSGFPAVTEGFEFVVSPYTDDDSIENVSTYLCAQWTRGARSRAYGVRYGDLPSALAFAQNTNNAFFAYMNEVYSLRSSYLETANFGCKVYANLNCQSSDIAASMTGQLMPKMLSPEVADRFSENEKAAMVEAGIGYFNVNRNGDVVIGRAVTTYTVANNGTLDYALRDINKPAMLACISKTIENELKAKFTGYSFRADGLVGSGSTRVATVRQIENFMIGIGQSLSNRNLIQNLEGFINSLVVALDPQTGCISITVSSELVDQVCCMTVLLNVN